MVFKKISIWISILLLLLTAIYLVRLQSPTFHILIATGGRPSLRNMMESLKNELNTNDALTIVFDGPHTRKKSTITSEWLNGFRCHVNLIDQVPNLGFWGHGIRNRYQQRLSPTTTFIMHADDDDTYIPGAFAKLRFLCSNPNTLYIAKMAGEDAIAIPKQNHKIQVGDIGTPCGIIPSAITSKSVWEHRYGGDGVYYIELQKHCRTVFLNEVIYRIR